MNIFSNLLFAQTHEWIKRGDDSLYWVGISNHAQEALGDILFLKLPDIGSCLKQGQACATIESLKAASDIHAPISGVVAEINAVATENPESINTQPYHVWLFKIQANDEKIFLNELGLLQSASQYESGISN
ncbi:MAG: glycine cleavage system protein H [Betaproteobacteria bacterium]|nr:glycine cleavage system protein H [Betaproteobacteria bacterium]